MAYVTWTQEFNRLIAKFGVSINEKDRLFMFKANYSPRNAVRICLDVDPTNY